MLLSEFKQLNRDNGFHWFSSGSMAFFQTKIEHWHKSGFFITSEVNPNNEKRYTIRKGNFRTGDVLTVGAFFEYIDLAEAKKYLKILI